MEIFGQVAINQLVETNVCRGDSVSHASPVLASVSLVHMI